MRLHIAVFVILQRRGRTRAFDLRYGFEFLSGNAPLDGEVVVVRFRSGHPVEFAKIFRRTCRERNEFDRQGAGDGDRDRGGLSVGIDDGDRIGSGRNTGRIEIEVDLRRADKGRPIHSDAAGRGSCDVVRPTRTTGIGARTLKSGLRTADIADSKTDKKKVLNTQAMGAFIVEQLSMMHAHVAQKTRDL